MTGFGQAAAENARLRVSVAVRSVNHRHLDLVFKLPEELRSTEADLRETASGRVYRGRVEISLAIERLQAPSVRVELRGEVVRELRRALAPLAEDGLIESTWTAGDVLRLPEVVQVTTEPVRWDPEDLELLRQTTLSALERLVEARRAEGARLASILEDRLAELSSARSTLEGLTADGRRRHGERLRERLDEVVRDSPEPLPQERIAQEVAVLLEKLDVREELDRLTAHLEHFREIMGGGEAIGRRLDFIVQEILRELNTLGSKARDADVSQAVIDAKSICEQLREQVQNVE